MEFEIVLYLPNITLKLGMCKKVLNTKPRQNAFYERLGTDMLSKLKLDILDFSNNYYNCFLKLVLKYEI